MTAHDPTPDSVHGHVSLDPDPLTRQFLPTPESEADAIASQLLWPDAGLTRYAILFSGRCGSTLLAHLIRDAGVCGFPDEYFNESFVSHVFAKRGHMTVEQYLAWLTTTRQARGYFGFKVDPMRLRWLQRFPQFRAPTFMTSSVTRLVWLTRKDVVSQGFSFAMAKKRGLWHVMNGEQPNASATSTDPVMAEEDVWTEIIDILSDELWMESRFAESGASPLRLDYETLVTDRQLTLWRVLRWIGVDDDSLMRLAPPEQEPTRRLSYDSRAIWVLRFLEKYASVLDQIQSARHSVGVEALTRQLCGVYGIAIAPSRLRSRDPA